MLTIQYCLVTKYAEDLIRPTLSFYKGSLLGYEVVDDPFWGLHLYCPGVTTSEGHGTAEARIFLNVVSKKQILVMLTLDNPVFKSFVLKFLEQEES